MAEITSLTPAGVRRLVALHPETRRLALRPRLILAPIAGPLPTAELEQRFADYVLDHAERPLVARTPDEIAWLERSLLVRRIAPGCALAIGDDLAGIVAAPQLLDGERLSERALQARFAPRADDALAAAIGLLSPDAAVVAIRNLAAHFGPDEDRLHLALLQAGNALAWRPDVVDADGMRELVDAMLALVERTSPKPLLGTLAPILGAIAATSTVVGLHARNVLGTRLAEMRRRITERRSGASFLDEFRALDRARAQQDEDYFMTLPDRDVAEAAARALGRSAERLGGAGFIALQSATLVGELGNALLPAFIDGLIAAAAIEPLAELAEHLLTSPDEESRQLGLHIVAQIPLDDCADDCIACLETSSKLLRTRATRAVAMCEPELAVPALIARLDDPEPDVCAAAAHALVELGQRDHIAAREMPGALAIGRTRERTAAARAALGEARIELLSTLVPLVAGELAREASLDDSPLVAALTAILRTTAEGIQLAAAIVREVPDTLPIIALALAGDDGAPSVALSPTLRDELAAVLDPIIAAGGEPAMLALETLSRFSRGDATMIDRIVDTGERNPGYAQQVLASLAYVRVRSERAATAIAPWIDSREHLSATMLATAVAGLVLPEGHRLWAPIGELYALGSIAASAAHGALVNAARVRVDG